MAVKVMITDDHSLIREGLKQLLELEGDFQVIAEACDGIECMEKLKEQIPDVLSLQVPVFYFCPVWNLKSFGILP